MTIVERQGEAMLHRSRITECEWIHLAPRSMVIVLAATSVAYGQNLVYEFHGSSAGDALGYAVAATGDLNGDGSDDFAIGAHLVDVAFVSSGQVRVRSGATGAVLYTWNGGAVDEAFGGSIAGMGDVNADGVPEVVVGMIGALGHPGLVCHARVYSGATGALLIDVTNAASPVDAFGYTVADAGDVDNDGIGDFMVSHQGNITQLQSVDVFSGSSQLALHTFFGNYGGDSFGRGLAALGDVNGDAFDDVAIGANGLFTFEPGASGRVKVYSGQLGNVVYEVTGTSVGNQFGAALANAGDVDGDGKNDLLVGAPVGNYAKLLSGGSGAIIRVLAGNSSNDKFGTALAGARDIDLDGIPDAFIGAVQLSTGNGYVSARSGSDGSELWAVQGAALSDLFGGALAAADVSADGIADLVVGATSNDNPAASAGAAYVYESPSPICSTTLPHYSVGLTPRDVLLVDRDGDGDRDAVTANSGAGTLTVLTNDGQGDFSAAVSTITLGAGDDPQSIVTQGTGLAVACPSTNAVRQLAAGAGSWTYSGTTLTPPGQRPVDVASGDLDSAGGIDLAIALEGSVFGIGGGVAVSLGGAPTMLPAPPGGFLSVKRVAVGDLDGDGDQDIVAGMTGTAFVAGPSANVLLYENDGSGTFSYAGALTGGGVPSGFSLRNIDSDNDVDLMVIAQAEPLTGTTSGLTVFKNNGTGALGPSRFTGLTQLASGSLPGDVVSLDLNSDSLPGFFTLEDVVVADISGSTLKGFRSFGSTTFASTEDLEADDTPVALAAGDLNGDGIPDLVAVNAGCDSMTVSLSALNALTQKFGTGCAGTGGKVPAISTVGSPTFGNPSFGVKLTNARAASFVYFGISLNYLSAPLGGCTLYLTPPVSFFTTFTNSIGQAQINLGIPNAVPPFVGLNAYFQYFVNDPVGGYSGFAFSDALRVRLGN